jgi:hypothetical protein
MVNYIRVAAKVKDPYTKVSKIHSTAFKSSDGLGGPFGAMGSMTPADKTAFVAFVGTALLNDGAHKEMLVPTTNARETTVNVDTNVIALHDKVYAADGTHTSPVEDTETGQLYYVYIYAKNETGYEFIQPSDVVDVSIFMDIMNNGYSRSAIDPPYQITLDEETDADPTKTPWVLVLNYIHRGGTGPSTTSRGIANGLPVLPSDGILDFGNININGTVPDGSTSNTGAWGHANNTLFDKVCIALGSSADGDNGLEVRFLGKTNGHSRIVHFKTNNVTMIKDFRYGNIPEARNTSFTNTTKYNSSYQGGSVLPIHTASLPDHANTLYGGGGGNAMILPFYRYDGPAHWMMRHDRWEVDDYPGNANRNTYHQTWIRANKPIV